MIDSTIARPATKALILHDNDDVAVVIDDVPAGAECRITAPSRNWTVTAVDDIAFGHKISVRAMDAGEVVIKYGHTIGIAATAIAAGAHVHTHNLNGVSQV